MHISSLGDHCSHLGDWLPHLPLMFSFIIPGNFSRQLDKTSLLFWNQDTQCWDIKCNTGQVKHYSLSIYILGDCKSFSILKLDLLITSPFKRALTLAPNLQYRLLHPHEGETLFQWRIIWFLNVALSFYIGLLLVTAVRINTWTLSNYVSFRSSIHGVGRIPHVGKWQLHLLGSR